MSRRFLVTAAIVIWSLTGSAIRPAAAQERATDAATPVASLNNSIARVVVATTDPASPVVLPNGFKLMKDRPTGMMPFYVSSVILHALDVHSTFKVIERGGREGNPLLAGIANNRPAFVAVKGAIAATTIYAVSRIAKKNRVAAFAMSAALNSMYGLVVSHNYKLAQSLR